MDNRPEQKDKISQEDKRDTFTEEQLSKEHPKSFEQLKADLKQKIKVRNLEKVKERKENPENQSRNLKIKISKPDKDAKTPAQTQKKNLSKITPEQMNLLINGVSNTVTFARNTEDVSLDETKTFSGALYEIADANGWLDDMAYLPYLVLAAAGTQLAIVIMTKPKKPERKHKIIENKPVDADIKKEVNPDGFDKVGNFDVVDQDELVKKINGV